MSEVRYMISDAADKLQMEAHVLRYWEEELELDVPRNEMGHRYYTEEWLRTFEQIRLFKNQGYQLKAIKMLIHNQNNHEPERFIMDLEKNLLDFDMFDQEDSAKENRDVPADASGAEIMPTTTESSIKSVDAAAKMEQFQNMMTAIVKNALAENNQQLGQAVSDQVGERVLKEMNYLMREREEQEEARFRKLDETLRTKQKKMKAEKEPRFKRKRKKTDDKQNVMMTTGQEA